MKVLSSFKESLVLLWNNPSIIGLALIINLVTFPESIDFFLFYLFSIEKVARIISGLVFLIIHPFFIAGILAMVHEASEGKFTSIKTFKRFGKAHYFDILRSTLVFFLLAIISMAFSSSILLVASKLGVGITFDFNVVLSLNTFLGFVALFFFQFFDVGIVIGGHGSTETIKQSFKFVWSRIPSVFGYSILALLIFLPVDFPKLLFSLTDGYPIVPAPPIIIFLYLLSTLIFSTISLALFFSFRGIYYIRTKMLDVN